jgi:hypothetical protein
MGKLTYSILIATMGLAVACGDSTTDAGGGPATGGGTNTGAGNQGGNPGTGGEDPGDAGFCALACEMPVDCCNGAPDCPGDFPNDWSCDGGTCAFNGCTDDMQCEMLFASPDYICLASGACAEECAVDADCTVMTQTCVDGACTSEADPCTTDADCMDFGVCDVDAGTCGCTMDGDCGVDGYVCAL